jgi:hypothetical protein
MKKLNITEHPLLEGWFIKKKPPKNKVKYLIIGSFIMLILTILFGSC